jgi:hypothetical protein
MSIRLHTPGLWTVDYTDDHLRVYAGDLLIAKVNGSTEHIEVRGLDEETTEANAWLIAAAPDLLAALERILARVETLNLFTERGEDAKVLEQVSAAIGKATGR